MQKVLLYFLSSILAVAATSCSVQTNTGNASTANANNSSSSLVSQASENGKTKLYSDIDMVTKDSGYAITKDLHLVKTSDQGGSWSDIFTITSDSDNSEQPGLFVFDDKVVYIASYTETGIKFEKSSDGGENWAESVINMNVDNVNSGYGGSISLSFISQSDGFLLASSLPATGKMSKALYKTTDGGNSWSLVNNWNTSGESLNSAQEKSETEINGYTTGVTFFNADTGYITCTYYGQKEISVYMTSDGGKTWSVASLPVPDNIGNDYYVDVYAPSIFREDNKKAEMELCFVVNDKKYPYFYSTEGSGSTWKIDKISSSVMKKYCFINSLKGFGIDENSILYTTDDGGTTWVPLS